MAKKEAVKAKIDKEDMQRMCTSLGVDKLFYNSSGECFTNKSYALASEGGDKKKVGTFLSKGKPLDAQEEEDAKKEKANE